MSGIKLLHPVHTVDNRVLLPAGTALSQEVIDSLIASNDTDFYKTYSLLQYGTIKKDFLDFISVPPYITIFADQEEISEILGLMDSVRLILPLLQSLDYFREFDFQTYRHVLMVFALSSLIAKYLIPDRQQKLQLAATGPTHDFGKICVPLDIIRKTTPLTRAEHTIVAQHTSAGYVLLSYYLKENMSLAAKVARDHHERRNGVGHPRGILLDDLMVEIIAVSDVYDALISPRPYRTASYDNRTALEEITRMAERNEVSWNVVKVLIAHNRKSKPHFEEGRISSEKRGMPPPGNVHGIFDDEED